jgi:hypothetical protein
MQIVGLSTLRTQQNDNHNHFLQQTVHNKVKGKGTHHMQSFGRVVRRASVVCEGLRKKRGERSYFTRLHHFQIGDILDELQHRQGDGSGRAQLENENSGDVAAVNIAQGGEGWHAIKVEIRSMSTKGSPSTFCRRWND